MEKQKPDPHRQDDRWPYRERPQEEPSPENRYGAAADGTREYYPHNSRVCAQAQPDTGGLNAAVYRTRWRYGLTPGLDFSGEVPHPTPDGRPEMDAAVVRREKRQREEFPYG